MYNQHTARKRAYLESLIRFLHNPSIALRTTAETQIKLYAPTQARELISEMSQLDSNDHDVWQTFINETHELREEDYAMQQMTERTIEKRGIKGIRILL